MERNAIINKDVYTILVVDDIKSICHSIRRELTMAVRERKDIYFRVLDEQDPEEALRKITENQPDLLISDIKMPYMTGDILVSEVKKKFPNLPVIVITGFATKENIVSVFKADPKAMVFSKPWDEKKFLTAVYHLLNLAEQEKIPVS